jgi:hypothetical protein
MTSPSPPQTNPDDLLTTGAAQHWFTVRAPVWCGRSMIHLRQ